jgi:hypothetical protein
LSGALNWTHCATIQTPIAPIFHPKMNSGKEFPSAYAALRRDKSAII